jgi:hypothetical protein
MPFSGDANIIGLKIPAPHCLAVAPLTTDTTSPVRGSLATAGL